MRITSPANPHVKAVVRLRQPRQRRATGRTIIEEARILRRALAAGVAVEELYVCPELADAAIAEALKGQAAAAGARLFEVPAHVLAKMAYREHPEGLLAVARPPQRTLADLAPPVDALLVVVEHLEKPGNLGAILRSLDAAGGHGLILCDKGTDIYNPNVIRASTGTVFALPVVEAEQAETAAFLHARGVALLAAAPRAARAYTQEDLTGPVALLLGSEHEGLSSHLRGLADRAIAIPMHGTADSLNVAAAATVLLFEAARQRHAAGGSSGTTIGHE